MKHFNSFLLIILLVISIQVQAQHPNEAAIAYSHLSEINKEWQNYLDYSPSNSLQFDTDINRIEYHLQLVAQYLKTNTSQDISNTSKAKRLSLIDDLKKYAANKQFPVNSHHQQRQPYFIDENGTHCAVGYLMAASGHGELAEAISQKYNYNYIAEIPADKVTPWAEEHGFTLDELAWIQPGYAPNMPFTTIAGSPNGEVKQIFNDVFHAQLVVTGDFTEIGGSSCNQIGVLKNNQFFCLGGGLDGEITAITSQNDGVYVAGDLEYNGTIYPAATYQNGDWSYIDIPGRTGATSSLIFQPVYGYSIGIVISHSSIPSKQEVWYLDDNGNWEKKATVDGTVYANANLNGNRMLAGSFNFVTIHTTGQSDVVVPTTNVIIRNNSTNDWFSPGSQVSETVKTIEVIGSAAYLGGTCSGGADVCLTRYLNGVLQPLVIYEDYFYTNDAYVINDIDLYEDDLIVGGDFLLQPLVGIYGNHLAKFDLTYNVLEAIANFDQPVNQVESRGDDLYFGGKFTQDVAGGNALPYFAKIGFTTSVDNPTTNTQPEIYPNPIINQVNIKGVEGDFDFSIFDISGKLLESGMQKSGQTIDFSKLSSGVYLLNILENGVSHNIKVVKGT